MLPPIFGPTFRPAFRVAGRFLLSAAIVAACSELFCAGRLHAADEYTLTEKVTDSRVFRVSHRLEVSGRLEAAVGEGQTEPLELTVEATHRYLERRLPGTGRGAAALRSLRDYETAAARIVVAKHATSTRLRDVRRRIVAQGRREGIVPYSPAGTLSGNELELLEVPGDSLALLSLLPPRPVRVGESWEPESWAGQMLTGTEAVLESSLTCKLESVTDDLARVSFNGSIDGATAGATAAAEIAGFFLFDLKRQFLARAELTQKERRSPGAVSPGMNVEAEAVLDRRPAGTPGPLDDRAVQSIPLEPAEGVMRLSLETPWRVRLSYDRDWHLFHQTERTAVLRLLEKGSLIAQCNVTRIAAAPAGEHTPEKEFQNDIRRALGDRLKSITRAEEIQVAGDPRFLYRVTAVGQSNGIDMHWFYYLCAAPSGRQASFVFAVETKLLDRLAGRDLAIVADMQFLPQPRAE